MTPLPSIFISYARRDARDLALRLQVELSANGYPVWLDLNNIPSGSTWSSEIEHAIDTCDITLALLSEGSHQSEICRAEQLMSLDKKKRVLPLLVHDGAPRPVYLYARQYLDFSNPRVFTDRFTHLRHVLEHGATEAAFSASAVDAAPPSLFIGRKDLLNKLERVIQHIDDERGVHFIVGDKSIGKTALLRHIQREAPEWKPGICLLFADFAVPESEGGSEKSAVIRVIRSLWAQILARSSAARRFYQEIDEPDRLSSQLVYLKSAFVKAAGEQPLLILLDNLHLDAEGVFRKWLKQGFEGQSVLSIVSYLQDAVTPPLDVTRNLHTLTKLQAFELGRLFDPPDSAIGSRIFALSGGMPASTTALLTFWQQEHIIAQRGDQFVLLKDLELPDSWQPRLESRLEAACEDLALELDVDMLLEWLLCAAVEGATFSEAGLQGATAEDVPPETSAALLTYLAAGTKPLIRAVEPYLPLSTPCWQFDPPGLSELLIRAAHPKDVSYYAVQLFDALDQAAQPFPFRLRHTLFELARFALAYQQTALLAQGLDAETLQAELRDSAAMHRLHRYQGTIDRETRIAELRLLLSLIPASAPRESWHIRQRLGLALLNFATLAETAATFRQARHEALKAHADGVAVAWLYYYESRCFPTARQMPLLKAAWRRLPQKIAMLQPEAQKFEEWLRSNLVDPHLHENPEKRSLASAVAVLLHSMGELYRVQRQFEPAFAHLISALRLLSQANAPYDLEVVFETLASLLFAVAQITDQSDDCQRAITLLTQADQLLHDLGDPLRDKETNLPLPQKLLSQVEEQCRHNAGSP